MPLLRFKTGDIMSFYTDTCECGRNTMRLGPVAGRKKQMIKFKGTSLYPPALYDILDDIEEVSNYVVEVYTNEIGTDEILIYTGLKNAGEKQEKAIKDRFRAKLRVAPKIIFKDPKEVHAILYPEGTRKAMKFIDKRKTKS
jgi:phenylacetate-CoA ligase